MKHIILLSVCFFSVGFSLAQTDTSKKTLLMKPVYQDRMQIKTIPASKAAVIRSDAFKLRTEMIQFRDSVTITKMELDKLITEMNTKLDNMNEMSEMESLRLQMAMDRLSKMMSTLSNLMKKISETSQSITQNLK